MTQAPPDTFTDWLAANPREGRRGAGVWSTNVIDEAPTDAGELAPYFLSLAPAALAGCWVACVVHQGGLTAGDAARALVVVAERLHGVKVNIQGVPVMVNAQPAMQPVITPRYAAPKAAAIPPEPIKVGKYEIHTGPAPDAPVRSTKKRAELYAAAVALPKGGWFVWTDAPKTVNCKALSAKLTKAAGFEVVMFKTAAGKVVVKRHTPEPT